MLTVIVTDVAGNNSETIIAIAGDDVGSPALSVIASVKIEADNGHDGYINIQECAGGKTDITVVLTKATAGEELTLTVNGTEYKRIITAEEAQIKSVTFKDIKIPDDGNRLIAEAVITKDVNGNKIADTNLVRVSDSALVDTTPPDMPTVKASATDGSVIVTPVNPKNGDKLSIAYKDETGDDKTITVIFIKDVTTGIWEDSDNNDSISINSETGVVTLPQDAVLDGSEVRVTVTDVAGNETGPVTEVARNDVGSPALTVISSVRVDADANHDGYINSEEYAKGPTSITVSLENATIGEELTLTVNGTKYKPHEITADDVDNKFVTFTGIEIPKDGDKLIAQAAITKDVNGNEIADLKTVKESTIVDLSVPTAPEVKSSITGGSDEIVDGRVTVTPIDAKNGDQIIIEYIDEDNQEKDVTFTKNVNTGIWEDSDSNDSIITINSETGVVTLPQDAVLDGSEVKARVQNVAGNNSEAITATAGQDVASSVSTNIKSIRVNADANHDGYINSEEHAKGNTTDITINLENATVGEQLTLTVNGTEYKEYERIITQQDVDNKFVTFTGIKIPDDGNRLIAQAAITEDVKRNKVAKPDVSTESTLVDLSVPTAPEVKSSITGGSDEIVDGRVTVTPIDAKNGDQIIIEYIDEDNQEKDVTFTKNVNTGIWEDSDSNDSIITINSETGVVTLPQDAVLDGSEVKARVQNVAGNNSEAIIAIAGDDVGSPALSVIASVKIEADNGHDGYINIQECAGGKTDIIVVLTKATAGEELTLTVNGTEYKRIITEEEAQSNSITFNDIDIPNDGDRLIAEAVITKDVNGNKIADTDLVKVSDSALVDITPPEKPTVIASATDGSVIVIPSNPKNGDVLSITYQDEKGGDESEPEFITVTFTKDAKTGIWEDSNNNDSISINSETGVVTLPQDAVLDGSEVRVTVTDVAGNETGPVTAVARNDVGSPALTVISSVRVDADVDVDGEHDGYINKQEYDNGIITDIGITTNITVSLENATLDEELKLTLTVKGPDSPDSITEYTHRITAQDVQNKSVTFTEIKIPDDGNRLIAQAAITKDVNGNEIADLKTVTESTIVDLSAPTGKVTEVEIVLDQNRDGYINKAEKSGSATTNVKVSLDDAVAVGDIIGLNSNNNGEYVIEVTANDVNAGYVTFTGVKLADEGKALTVNAAVLRDLAGNIVKDKHVVTKHVQIDTVGPTGNVTAIDIVLDDQDAGGGPVTGGGDGYINASEKGGFTKTDIKVSFDDKVVAGDIVGLDLDNDGVYDEKIEIKDTDLTGGRFVTFTGIQLPQEGQTLKVQASIIGDQAGNSPASSPVKLSKQATIDTVVQDLIVKSYDGNALTFVAQEAGTVIINIGSVSQKIDVTRAQVGQDLKLTLDKAVKDAFSEGRDPISDVDNYKTRGNTLPGIIPTEPQIKAMQNEKEKSDQILPLSFKDVAGNTMTSNAEVYHFKTGDGPYYNVSALNPEDKPQTGSNAFTNPNDNYASNTFTTRFNDKSQVVYVDGDVSGYSTGTFVVDMGAGNDVMNVKGSIAGNVTVKMGEDNDILSVAGLVVSNTNIDMGKGNDILNVKGQIQSGTTVKMGEGDDVIILDQFAGARTSRISIDLGSGNNVLNQESTNIRADHFRYVDITAGNGKDIITANARVFDSTINLGDGENTITANQEVNNTTIITGVGEDTVNLLGIVKGATINLGSGNDKLSIVNPISNTTIDLGDGNDIVRMDTKLTSDTSINLGSGNDIFYYGGWDIDGTLSGGEGIDTFVFTSTSIGKERFQQNWADDTTGFEIFDINGTGGKLSIRASEVLKADNQTIEIRGEKGDVLDIGSNNADKNTTDKLGYNNSAKGRIADYRAEEKIDDAGFWQKQNKSDKEGFDLYVYEGSKNNPYVGNQPVKLYVDIDITVI